MAARITVEIDYISYSICNDKRLRMAKGEREGQLLVLEKEGKCNSPFEPEWYLIGIIVCNHISEATDILDGVNSKKDSAV